MRRTCPVMPAFRSMTMSFAKTSSFIGQKTVTDLIRRIAWFKLKLYSVLRATHQENHKDVSLKDFFSGANPKHQIETKDTTTVREQQPGAELVKR